MVHLFNWTWNDVARECEQVLAPAGYDAVQISPPMEHALVEGRSWYERYQPVSFRLESRSGTEPEFAEMVRRCSNAGIMVVADVVLNHMAWRPAAGTAFGSGGTRYGAEFFPQFTAEHFHRCRPHDDLGVRDYQNRWEVQNCEIAILPDLATERADVRALQSEFLLKLYQMGVRGFRIDAAKHMPAKDVEKIVSGVKDKSFVFSEVIGGHTEAIRNEEYLGFGHVTEFVFSQALGAIFKGGKLSHLRTVHQWQPLLPSENAVVFVDNHDNQRGHGAGGDTLTFKWSDAYKLANIFMLAFDYGTPAVMSSYHFNDPNQGPPQTGDGTLIPALNERGDCHGGWVCEHRWLQIRNAVKLRASTSPSAPVLNWFDNGNRFIAFSRGTEAFIAINAESHSVNVVLQTGLSGGLYPNVFDAEWGSAYAPSVVVNPLGEASLVIHPYQAVMLHAKLRK
jgi:alpha-amylase